MNGPVQSGAGTASLSDLLTAAKNIVTAINGLTTAYTNVQGAQNLSAISSATLVSAAAGRICRVSITTSGSAVGTIYDGGSLTALSRPIWIIPNTVGVGEVNIPVSFGIVVVPGTGQVVTVSYS